MFLNTIHDFLNEDFAISTLRLFLLVLCRKKFFNKGKVRIGRTDISLRVGFLDLWGQFITCKLIKPRENHRLRTISTNVTVKLWLSMFYYPGKSFLHRNCLDHKNENHRFHDLISFDDLHCISPLRVCKSVTFVIQYIFESIYDVKSSNRKGWTLSQNQVNTPILSYRGHSIKYFLILNRECQDFRSFRF